MKLKEKLGLDFIRSYSKLLPGGLDRTEALNCYLAGFRMARKLIAQLIDQKTGSAWNHEIDDIGEEEVDEKNC